MFRAKQQNETFQVKIHAFEAVRKLVEDPNLAKLFGISTRSRGKAFKDWTESDREIKYDTEDKTSVSVTFLHSDSVFFIESLTGSHMVTLRNKALLFSEVLGRVRHPQSKRIEFRVYCRRVGDSLCLTTAFFAAGEGYDLDGELHILADWPMFEIDDDVYKGFGFKVKREESDPLLGHTDVFGEDTWWHWTDYEMNGVQYSVG